MHQAQLRHRTIVKELVQMLKRCSKSTVSSDDEDEDDDEIVPDEIDARAVTKLNQKPSPDFFDFRQQFPIFFGKKKYEAPFESQHNYKDV